MLKAKIPKIVSESQEFSKIFNADMKILSTGDGTLLEFPLAPKLSKVACLLNPIIFIPSQFRHLLRYAKRCFFSVNTFDATNTAAAASVQDSIENYRQQAKLCVLESIR